METSTALLTLCAIHRSPVNSPHKGQWRGALMFSLICTWTNDWVNNRDHDMIFVKMTASSAASDDNFIKTTRLLFQWRWMHSNTLVFSLICAWTNGWVNIRDVGDLRRHGAYYDVIIMDVTIFEAMDVIAKLRTLHVMTTQSYGPSFESNGFHRVFIPLSFHYRDNCDTWNLPSIAIN